MAVPALPQLSLDPPRSLWNPIGLIMQWSTVFMYTRQSWIMEQVYCKVCQRLRGCRQCSKMRRSEVEVQARSVFGVLSTLQLSYGHCIRTVRAMTLHGRGSSGLSCLVR